MRCYVILLAICFFYGIPLTWGRIEAQSTNQYFLSVLTRIHNNAKTIREFVKHHQEEGVDHFFFLDDRSTDNFSTKLSIFPSSLYTILPIHDERMFEHQSFAMNEIYQSIRNQSTYIALLDIDEFLISRLHPGATIKEILSGPLSSCDAITAPWILFAFGDTKEEPSALRTTNEWRFSYESPQCRHLRLNPGETGGKRRNWCGRTQGKPIVKTSSVSAVTEHAAAVRVGGVVCLAMPPSSSSSQGLLNNQESGGWCDCVQIHTVSFSSPGIVDLGFELEDNYSPPMKEQLSAFFPSPPPPPVSTLFRKRRTFSSSPLDQRPKTTTTTKVMFSPKELYTTKGFEDASLLAIHGFEDASLLAIHHYRFNSLADFKKKRQEDYLVPRYNELIDQDIAHINRQDIRDDYFRVARPTARRKRREGEKRGEVIPYDRWGACGINAKTLYFRK